jgi:DNA-binding Lrp family transcriptional regulator
MPHRIVVGSLLGVAPQTIPPAYTLDDLDGRIIELWRAEPRIGVLETSRRLEVARGTVQARIDKMLEARVISGFGPELDLNRLGFTVLGFTTIEVAQGRTEEVIEHLATIPYVLEAHSIAGQGDLLVRIAAKTNEELMSVLQQILQSPAVDRASTAIALANHIAFRTSPLLERLTAEG